MEDQLLFEQFHEVFEIEPRPASFDRLRSEIIRNDWQTRRPRRIRLASPRVGIRLAAAIALVVLAVASVGAFIAITRYVHRTIPVQAPPLAVYPISSGNLSPALGRNSFFFTANDAVLASTDGHPQITHDGGKTWLRSPATFFYGSMEWLDARHIYFWGPSTNHSIDPDVPGGVIFEETGDGGLHWHYFTVGGLLDPTESFFLDAKQGWSLQWGCQIGQPCAIYGTVDSGSHWQQLASLRSSMTAPASGILFTDSKHGFIGSESDDGVGRLYTSKDGGKVWQLVVLPSPSGGWPGGLNAVAVPQMFGLDGILIDQTNAGYSAVYVTHDGGAVWQGPRLLTVPMNLYATPVFVDGQEGWLVDSKGELFRTVDGGASWQPIGSETPRGLALTSVAPVGGHVLWGEVTDGNSVFAVRSTDDGAHWQLVSLLAPAR